MKRVILVSLDSSDLQENRERRETEGCRVHRELQDLKETLVFQGLLDLLDPLDLLVSRVLLVLKVLKDHLVRLDRREKLDSREFLDLQVHLVMSSTLCLSSPAPNGQRGTLTPAR